MTDEPDWPALLRKLLSQARRLCARMHMPQLDEGDLLGETVVDLMVRWRNGRKTESWSGLASTILRRKATRQLRHKDPMFVDLTYVASPASRERVAPDPGKRLIRTRIAILRGATERLVAAFVADGVTLVEIAGQLGRSVRSVVRACERATATLEKHPMLDSHGT